MTVEQPDPPLMGEKSSSISTASKFSRMIKATVIFSTLQA